MPNSKYSSTVKKNPLHQIRRRRLRLEMLEGRRLLASGNGLLGQYYDNGDLSGTPLVRLDAEVDFDWGSTGPGVGPISGDDFSVRWSGQVEARFTELHQFIVSADDGARLWVNGQLLFDRFDSGPVTEESHVVSLIAGRRYDIQLEYREVSDNAAVSLEWSSPSLMRETIPTAQLFAAQRGAIQQQQWNNLPGASVSDLENWPAFPESPDGTIWLTQFETAENSGDQFGRRLRGFVHPPVSGAYQFFVASDETAELRLSLNGQVDSAQMIAQVTSPTGPRDWDMLPEQSSDVIYLQAGQRYYIEALSKEATGDDHLAVAWLRPDRLLPEVVPGDALSPAVPEVRMYAINPRVSEASTAPARFQVVRSGDSTLLPLDVYYTVQGNAEAGVDYVATSGVVTIPAGQSTAEITIHPLLDGVFEGDEQLTIALQAGPDYALGYRSERSAVATLQDDQDPPAGGVSLWNGQTLADFGFYGGSYSTQSDPTYGSVIQAVIPPGQADPWSSALLQATDAPVTEGDILLLEFRVRALGGIGELSANFERAGTPYTKSLSQGVPASEEWQRIQMPFTAVESYAIGEAQVSLHLGSAAQTLQFADFQLLNFGPSRSLAPETAFWLNNISGSHGVAQTVPVTGQPFTFAYEVQTTSVPAQVWHLQAVDRNDGVVRSGDVMRFEFSVRATAGSNPRANFAVQRTDTFATLSAQTMNLTSEWQSFSVDVPVTEDFSANGLQAVFNVGFGLQTVEIGGFHWSNLSNAFDVEDLPNQFPASSYEGRAGVDTWRTAAEQRIVEERMSSLTIEVLDANNQPLPGATIGLRQKRHEFRFGSAISAFNSQLDPGGNATALKYQSEIKRLFNTVVLENSLKWPSYQQDPQRAMDGVNFALNNDLHLRGHNLIWPSRTYMPGSVWAEYDSRASSDGTAAANGWLESTIEAHFNEILTTFDGMIPEWDVVNEPFTNRDVMDLLGDQVVVDWYQQVRDFDPSIQLTLNDYNIFTRNGTNLAHRASFEYWMGLLDNAQLLDVIGVQSHFSDSSLTDMEVLSQLIEQYDNQFDASIAVTEFDLNSTDEQLQADYLRDYMLMTFSQPAVKQFLHWGFWQEAHWLPNAALYRSDFSIKPNGQAYEDAVFGRWWTDAVATSAADGTAIIPAFLGEYEVVVQYQGQTYVESVVIDGSGLSQISLTVDQTPQNAAPLLDVNQSSLQGTVNDPLINGGRWRDPELDSVTFSASVGEVQGFGDGTWLWTYVPSQPTDNQEVIITAVDARGASAELRFVYQSVAAIRPTLAPPMIAGTAWDAGFLDIVDAGTSLGMPMSVGMLALPYNNLNRIYLQFSEDVQNVSTATIELLNSSGSVPISVSYDASTFVATIIPSAILGPNKYRLAASTSITDTSGNALDGDGVGGILNFRFDVLPGDRDGNRLVSTSDLVGFGLVYNTRVGQANYNARFDWNADGRINTVDLPIFSQNYNRRIDNLSEPGAPFGGGGGSSFKLSGSGMLDTKLYGTGGIDWSKLHDDFFSGFGDNDRQRRRR